MTAIAVLDYRPDPDLDQDLADLGYAAVFGWSDQRPFTASLVRSRLRPTGTIASTLALSRDLDGRLLAAAALRWPATLEGTGTLWGPVVHPAARGHGLGTALLQTAARIVAARPGMRIISGAIPHQRTAGWALYERAGWHPHGGSNLLKRPLPTAPPGAEPGRGPTPGLGLTTGPGPTPGPVAVTVRAVRPGEYPDQALAALYAAARPHQGYATARDTYTRWSTDERYTSDGLLLAHAADEPLLAHAPERLLGAALIYPLTGAPGEPPEAFLADLIISTNLDLTTATTVRDALVAAALAAATASGAAVARAIIDCPHITAALLGAGFRITDQIRYYAPPTEAPTNATQADKTVQSGSSGTVRP